MTPKQLGDQPAFPLDEPRGANYGLTYRQWLVGMAMQGLVTQNPMGDKFDTCAEAVAIADNVLAELAKEGE